MRILAVRGANLASLDGAFAVELDDGPLRHAGLFAITGPTGAGKSTILDALCLALFDRMPRMPDGRGVQLGRDGDPDAISSTDVRGVLRRGAGSGWAEVDFVGADGERYRARWELRRARQSARGKLQDQTMTLSSLDGSRRFGDGKKRSVQDEICARLGLNFEQFRRAVLLAQGDFATFLKTPAKDRSELLELLTGTEIYSRISKAAYERAKEEQSALDRLDLQCSGIAVLTEEERAALVEAATTGDTAVREGEAALEAARATERWHKDDARFAADEAEATARASDAERAWSDAAPRREVTAFHRRLRPLRPLLTDADRCAREADAAAAALTRAGTSVDEARREVEQTTADHARVRAERESAVTAQSEAEPTLERAAALDGRIDTLSGQGAEAVAELTVAAERTEALRREADALDRALGDARRAATEGERWLAERVIFVPIAEQWARWNALLLRHGDVAREHDTADARARAGAEDAAEHERELARLTGAHDDAKTACAAAERALVALQGESVMSLAEIARRRDRLSAQRDSLTALARIAEKVEGLAKDEAEAATERERSGAEADAATTASADAKARLVERQAALAEAEETLRRLHIAGGKSAAALRGELTKGEPCPVCGAIDHPWGSAEAAAPLRQLADDQTERVVTLRAAAESLVKDHAGWEVAAGAARARALQLDQRLTLLRRDRVAAVRSWAERASALDTEMDLPAAPESVAVADRMTAVEAELAVVARDEAAALDHKARLDAATAERRSRGLALEEMARSVEARSRQRDAARHAVELAIADRDRAVRQRNEALAELAEPFGALDGWGARLRADPEGFRTELEARVGAFLARREAQAKAAREAESLTSQVTAKNAELASARDAEAALRRRADGLTGQVDGLRSERAGLLNGRPVAEVKRALAEARQQAEAALDKAARAQQEASTRLSAAERELETRGEAAQRRAEAAETAQALLTGAAADRSVTVEEARRQLGRDDAELEREETALADLDRRRAEAALLLRERARQRAEHHAGGAPALTAEEAAVRIAETARALDEARGRVGEAKARLRADAENRERLAALLDRVTAQRATRDLWAGLSRLIGSADGGKLRNFAQSLSLDLLLEQANRYLDDLARRYRLERVAGQDLEIQVVDREMGDERRGVHSLSGGEMFLVSLALALGLSAMAGAGAGGGMGGAGDRIGTLFIDEGFGTLDPDSLDMALSCLEALQATGRQVGVISHVPALVERIGVQVRVRPQGGGRSAVTVVRGGVTAFGAVAEASPLDVAAES